MQSPKDLESPSRSDTARNLWKDLHPSAALRYSHIRLVKALHMRAEADKFDLEVDKSVGQAAS